MPGMQPILSDRALVWAPAFCAAAHIFEEFVFPGGFSEWYRKYRPDAARSFTPRFAVAVNALLLAACLLVPQIGLPPRGVALWLTLAALLFANALFHMRASLRTREYSPGVITSVVLYIPLALYGFLHFVQTGQASVGTAVGAAVLGGSYNFISAGLHRRRARRASS